MLILCVLGLLVFMTNPSQAALYTWDGGIHIPDNGWPDGAIATIDVSDSYLVDDIDIMVTICHTWDSDLDIYVKSPLGAMVELSTDNGGEDDCYICTWFDDEADISITDKKVRGPFTGTYIPEGQLNEFDAQNVNGVWELIVCDDYELHEGYVTAFKMDVTAAAVPLPGTVVLLVSGLGALFGLRSRFGKKS